MAPEEPVHVNLASKINLKGLHFTLQQIQRIGISAGLMSGAFAARLKDLSDEELNALHEKIRRATRDALKFAQKSYDLGNNISVIDAKLDKKLNLYINAINKRQRAAKSGWMFLFGAGITSAAASDSFLRFLQRQRDRLQKLREYLRRQDQRRRSAENMEDLEDVEEEVNATRKEAKDIPDPRSFFSNIWPFNRFRQSYGGKAAGHENSEDEGNNNDEGNSKGKDHDEKNDPKAEPA